MSDEQLFVVGTILFLVVITVCSLIYSKYTMHKKVKDGWGKEPKNTRFDKEESLKHVYDIIRKHKSSASIIDDLTWHDLDLFSVFKQLNHTHSSIGSEALYQHLRRFDFNQSDQAHMEKLIDFLRTHPEKREKIELAFAQLGKKDKNFLVDYLLKGEEKHLGQLSMYVFLGLLPLLSLGLFFFSGWSEALLLLLFSIVFNIVYYQRKKITLDVELTSMGYLVQTLVTAKKLTKVDHPLSEKVHKAIRPLKGILRFSFSFRVKAGSETEVLFDYLNAIIMLPFISYHFVLNRLSNHHEEAFTMWELLGKLEIASAILNYRTYKPSYCLPEFKAGGVESARLAHPLIDEPVVNPVHWERNTLVTGSNASGKSTYVKAVAINCILAQTIYTCTAESFTLEPGHVLTSMAVQDDIFEGDSYFVAEIKSLKRLLTKPKTNERCYLFIDEILKGTNTIERIAASSNIVKWLSQFSSLAFVATHDIELTTMLESLCDNVHFQEQVTEDQGIHFDYLLREGPATSRNALRLLQVMNYPEEMVQQAHTSAQIFDETEHWEPLA